MFNINAVTSVNSESVNRAQSSVAHEPRVSAPSSPRVDNHSSAMNQANTSNYLHTVDPMLGEPQINLDEASGSFSGSGVEQSAHSFRPTIIPPPQQAMPSIAERAVPEPSAEPVNVELPPPRFEEQSIYGNQKSCNTENLLKYWLGPDLVCSSVVTAALSPAVGCGPAALIGFLGSPALMLLGHGVYCLETSGGGGDPQKYSFLQDHRVVVGTRQERVD